MLTNQFRTCFTIKHLLYLQLICITFPCGSLNTVIAIVCITYFILSILFYSFTKCMFHKMTSLCMICGYLSDGCAGTGGPEFYSLYIYNNG